MRRINPLTGKMEIVRETIDPFEQARLNKERMYSQEGSRPYQDPFEQSRDRIEAEYARPRASVRIHAQKRGGRKDSYSKSERRRAMRSLGVGKRRVPLFDQAMGMGIGYLKEKAFGKKEEDYVSNRPLRIRSLKQAEREAMLESSFETKFFINKEGRVRYKAELPQKPEHQGWFKRLKNMAKKKPQDTNKFYRGG